METGVIFLIIVAVIIVIGIFFYYGNKKEKKENTPPVQTKEREPISTWDGDTPVLVMYISSCANMMIAGEVNYLRSIGKFENKFNKSKAGDYVLERISLIVSFLSIYKIQIKDGWDRLWLKAISTNYDTSKTITDNNIKSLFDERISFYSDELDVLKSISTPLPNEIISQLYKPMVPGPISHNISTINGFTVQENMMLWKIITSEVGKMMEKVEKNKEFIYSSPNNP
jgi:hypothetical protein